MEKIFEAKVNSVSITVSVESPEQIIVPKGWGIPEWENFFISRRDNKHQIPETWGPCAVARRLFEWARICRAELISVADKVGLWVFTFGFDSAENASEFLSHAEALVLDLSAI